MQNIIKPFIGVLLLSLTAFLLSGCFEDKIKVDMATYYAEVAPKIKEVKGTQLADFNGDPATRSASCNAAAEKIRTLHKELLNITPKTPEIQSIHQKICAVMLAGAVLIEEIGSLPAEPNQEAAAKMSRLSTENKNAEKEIATLLEWVFTEHKSQEAKQLILDLDLGPRKN